MGIQIFEQRDKLHTSMPLFYPCDDMAVVEIEPGENRPGSLPEVLGIAGDCRMFATYRRQVWSGVADGLHARLLIHGNRDYGGLWTIVVGSPVLECDFLIHHQNFPHFSIEIRITALQVILDFVWL